MATITMTYGAYSFAPNPLFSWSTEMLRDSRGSGIGLSHSLDFSGTFLETSGDQTNISDIIAARSGLQAALEVDNQEFKILQDSVGLVSGVYPKISSLTMDEGTWYDKASYAFSATWEESLGSDNVSDFSESWSYTESDDRRTATVSHSISAVGIDTSTSGNNALSNATSFVNSRTGSSNQQPSHPAFVQVSGSYSAYEGLRSEDVDVAAGSFSVSEQFTLSELSYVHTQTASMDISDGVTSIKLDGEVKGLGRSTTAYDAALSGWTNTIEPSLESLASGTYSELGGSATLYTSSPVSESLGTNQDAGIITYSRQYSDSEADNLPSGIESLTINASDQQPVELTASMAIFGRALGNVVQTIGTPTEGTFSIQGSAKGEQGFPLASLITYAEGRIDAIRPLSANYTTLRLDEQSVDTDEDANEISFSLTWKYTKNLSAAKIDGAVDLGS